MIEKPLFWDWATFSEDAILTGIKPDAPQEAKQSYEEHLKELKQAEEDLIKF